MQANEISRWREAIGPNADRYLRVFDRIERASGKWVPGWNWAAFLYSTGWFFHRRMFGYALLNFFASLFFLAALAVTTVTPSALGDTVILAYIAITSVLVPMHADAIYYRDLSLKLAPAGGRTGEHPVLTPARAGARTTGWLTGLAGLAHVVAGLFVVAFFISQLGYETRRKVGEGLTAAVPLVMEITEFHAREKRLPNEAEAARFRRDLQGRYSPVKSVHYDSVGQRVVITMGVRPYENKQFGITLTIRDGALVRKCETIDLDYKYLPGSCSG